MRVELIKQFQFEAAHTTQGKLHGHSYIVEVKCEGLCDPALGWLVDYGDISAHFEPLYRQLDHYALEEIADLNDTSLRGIEAWLASKLETCVPHFASVRVRISGDCAFVPARIDTPDAFDEPPRIRFGFEAAHYLPQLPPAHKCRRMHGHSFRVEVAAVDLEGLEPLLKDLYDTLDHRCLNELDGLENATSEQVARWVWQRLGPHVPDLRSVTVAETCTARCVYRGL